MNRYRRTVGVFPGGSVVKNSRVIQETWFWSLGQEDPPEKETAIHSSIFAQRIPWTKEPGRLQSTRSQESDTAKRFNNHHHQESGSKPLPTAPRTDKLTHPAHESSGMVYLNKGAIWEASEAAP